MRTADDIKYISTLKVVGNWIGGMMRKLASIVTEKCINGGFPLLLMGIFWLGLWLFPWFPEYVQNPHWGHNFSESMAFLSVGLAYYNRRFLSYLFSTLAAALIIPVSLELLPHNITAVTSAILVCLIIIDIIVERKSQRDLLQASSPRTSSWLRKYLPYLSYIFLATLALSYFLIRVPAGTYETDSDTVVFDALLLPLVAVLLLEKLTESPGRTWPAIMAFFSGMGVMIVLLIMLSDQPETWPVLIFMLLVTCLALIALLISRRLETKKAQLAA
jgi:hypothetical protein